jgi:hypothetical protein
MIPTEIIAVNIAMRSSIKMSSLILKARYIINALMN